MDFHDSVFWFCAFFLLGIFIASLAGTAFTVLAAIFVFLFILVFKKRAIAFLALSIAVGGFYLLVFDSFQKIPIIPFEEKIDFEGVVVKIDKSGCQKLEVELKPPYGGKISVNLRRYPEFEYGDLIKFNGAITKPPISYKKLFLKNGIAGESKFPESELIKSGEGNFIKEKLFKFKEKVKYVFKKVLPLDKAAFISGLIMGDREDFSKELKDQMVLSGTTHLVALSGYNISVIALSLAPIFNALFPAVAFYLNILVISLFRVMPGPAASVVRASIMAIILIWAEKLERRHSMRNAIAVTAFLMAVINPRILAFDLGFQLSFAALLGIIYLAPAIKNIFRFKDAGFWNYKENLVTTLAAQFAVAPILFVNFGSVSITSFLANILILEAVPMTMGLGFLIGGLGLVSIFLAKAVSLIANIFLTYELWIIKIFADFSFVAEPKFFGWGLAVVYYLILVVFIMKFREDKEYGI